MPPSAWSRSRSSLGHSSGQRRRTERKTGPSRSASASADARGSGDSPRPQGRFTRAIQQRNPWAAKMSLRGLADPPRLEAALAYLDLLAGQKPEKLERSARRPCQDLGRVGHGLRRNVERDALTVKGGLSKRISLSMTQPAPRLSSYIAIHLTPSRWALGLRSDSGKCMSPGSVQGKRESEAARPLLTRPLRRWINGRVPKMLYPSKEETPASVTPHRDTPPDASGRRQARSSAALGPSSPRSA